MGDGSGDDGAERKRGGPSRLAAKRQATAPALRKARRENWAATSTTYLLTQGREGSYPILATVSYHHKKAKRTTNASIRREMALPREQGGDGDGHQHRHAH
jgi:hypothetical protein